MNTIKNQPIYRRTKNPAVDLLAQLERTRATQRARERQAEKDAERFRSERTAQGYAASQIFGPTQTERDAAAESAMRNPLKDLIRYVSREELERLRSD